MIRLFFFCLAFLGLMVASLFAQPIVDISPSVAWQGKVIEVKIPAAGITGVEGKFLGQKFKLYPQEDNFVGIIGVPTDQKPGNYNLRLIITQTDGKTIEQVEMLKVWPTKFPVTRYWLKPSRNKLRARNIIDNEWSEIEKVLLHESEKRLWSGQFALPVKGEKSQGFGQLQIINGKRSGSHKGVDLAVPIGTKVFAPNAGQVVFTQKLKAFGGTVVVDHGQGIHTLYFHLSKFAAEVGQDVKQGDLIAYSGNTGVSTGAHLHWGMSVHNLRVDPEQWVKYEM
ncbi:hypothetical protein COT42_01150 [Candidatus Saganbacteria bacterium CG08_land_8_20_14_0_20_45_16]|uniref:M23ase beta-sheet core domain-containing protein n=1 Tax=Candidatus Saganbacteria bacterium CG08_land_8_20_14_0_20_45_16 TaxID=2014293 RepID=A0A2H0Y3L0_UNCSA|nr:MAG: hypothetical protein COT42_01150 [Candidatus Saganbacteria bacterium CG08_land_8_20_14_0_20_45_16]